MVLRICRNLITTGYVYCEGQLLVSQLLANSPNMLSIIPDISRQNYSWYLYFPPNFFISQILFLPPLHAPLLPHSYSARQLMRTGDCKSERQPVLSLYGYPNILTMFSNALFLRSGTTLQYTFYWKSHFTTSKHRKKFC